MSNLKRLVFQALIYSATCFCTPGIKLIVMIMTTSSGAASHPTEVENVFGLDLQLFRERLSESARDNPERYYGWF